MDLPTNGRITWIPIVATLLAQTAGIVWWASTLTSRVAQQAQLVESQQHTINLLVETARDAKTQLIQVQTIQHELRNMYEPQLKELLQERNKPCP
jgi:ATPase subunit of ABC transporter with duplicated ATPase domains